jgi:hypothetical protein
MTSEEARIGLRVRLREEHRPRTCGARQAP